MASAGQRVLGVAFRFWDSPDIPEDQLEKYSSAITLSDMEIFVFPELLYSLVLANPPFAGSLDYESTAKDLLQVVKTKKTELLFLALFLRLLKPGGRAAVIVPDVGAVLGGARAGRVGAAETQTRRGAVHPKTAPLAAPCP